MLILRPATTGDLGWLVDLAGKLDLTNLPSDPEFLSERVGRSLESFAERVDDWRRGIYVFMLEDAESGRCIGSATILAKHGTPEAPFYWLEVSTEERSCSELGRRFVHTKLQLRSTEDGPTEIGGLILDPAWRGQPGKHGKALSVVRFAYMGAHPDRFERYVIAEMLSPFDAPGKNRLWDAFGARFTGLSYREADRLSVRSKQFIADLFPCDPVYATLFPETVQAVIGETSAPAATRILQKLGFHYLNQVDPFDGGPYYGAARDAIVSVRERRVLVLPGVPRAEEATGGGPLALISAEGTRGFRATVLPLDDEGSPIVPKRHREALGVAAGDRVSITPLP